MTTALACMRKLAFVLTAFMLWSAAGWAEDGQGSALAKSCIAKAIGPPSGTGRMSSKLERAVSTIQLEIVFDALLVCRAAMAREPDFPKIATAHNMAVKAISILAFGTQFKGSETDGVAIASKYAEKADGLAMRIAGIYLGSAYEYGRGAKKNLSAARRWYAKAARAGSKIAAQQLIQIQGK